MRRNLLFLFTIIFLLPVCNRLYGQVGGEEVFEFINLPASARITSLAGNLITVRDDDVNLPYQNPASANPLMHQALAFNHNFFLSDIYYGYFAYGHHVPKWGTTLHGGIQYINYGSFDQTDVFGNIEGTFKAAEYAVTIGAGRELYERMAVGANIRFITSQLESYSSFGIAADVAAMFYDTASNFTATLVFRNMGSQVTTYRQGNREPIPFEMQIGVSKRLKHLPFRFSIIFHHLNRWNILYDDPNADEPGSLFGEVDDDGNPWLDNFFRHFSFNGEFLFGKKENLRLRLGYNHFRHKEMTVRNYRSFAGFTFGAGIKINRFRLDYGREIWHIAGGVNHIGISTNLSEFRR